MGDDQDGQKCGWRRADDKQDDNGDENDNKHALLRTVQSTPPGGHTMKRYGRSVRLSTPAVSGCSLVEAVDASRASIGPREGRGGGRAVLFVPVHHHG